MNAEAEYGYIEILRWIPVGKALPPFDVQVLVCNDKYPEDWWVTHRTDNDDVIADGNRFANNCPYPITHWVEIAPMPTPMTIPMSVKRRIEWLLARTNSEKDYANVRFHLSKMVSTVGRIHSIECLKAYLNWQISKLGRKLDGTQDTSQSDQELMLEHVNAVIVKEYLLYLIDVSRKEYED